MNINDAFLCAQELTTQFAQSESFENFVRFTNDDLPDSYSTNFISINSAADLELCGEIINDEIKIRKKKERSFCVANLAPRWQENSDLARLCDTFLIKPSIDNYLMCVCDDAGKLKLGGRKDCDVRKIVNSEMAFDRTLVEIVSYADTHGKDFCMRKGEYNAKIYLSKNAVDAFVCYYDEKPIGKAELFVHGEWGMIEDFDVLPDMQRKGFGTAILRELVDEAISRGASKVLLVAEADDTAKDMYEKLGFVQNTGQVSLFFEL